MSDYQLSPQISLGPVELTIRNLDQSIDFYTQVIGFDLISRNLNHATLGMENIPLVQLVENPAAQQTRGTTGLYHFAILVPQRNALAEALKRIIRTETPVQGFADHGVSEAIYLPDPDGNGIEIYRDRPRPEWPFKNGELQMITDPLDLEDLLSESNGDDHESSNMPTGTKIGHMHLHVRDIPETVSFYRDVLGFDLKQRFGSSAAFLAAGDYHHHIGVNTWAGVGAPPPPDGSVGLRSFSIRLPENDFNRLELNLRQNGIEYRSTEHGFKLKDPSGNLIQFCVLEK